MFIEKLSGDLFLIPKGLYVRNAKKLHIIPSGFWNITLDTAYKHKFPSGMCNKRARRHKADNPIFESTASNHPFL